MKRIQSPVVWTLSVLAPLALSGCAAVLVGAAAGAGAGTAAYVMGDLEKAYDLELETVYRASKAGVEDMEFRITEDLKDLARFKIVSQMADGKKVTVSGRYKDNVFRLSIRVGTFGNETVSRQILDKIERHL